MSVIIEKYEKAENRQGGTYMKVIEGYMPYLGYQTYYRIVGGMQR